MAASRASPASFSISVSLAVTATAGAPRAAGSPVEACANAASILPSRSTSSGEPPRASSALISAASFACAALSAEMARAWSSRLLIRLSVAANFATTSPAAGVGRWRAACSNAASRLAMSLEPCVSPPSPGGNSPNKAAAISVSTAPATPAAICERKLLLPAARRESSPAAARRPAKVERAASGLAACGGGSAEPAPAFGLAAADLGCLRIDGGVRTPIAGPHWALAGVVLLVVGHC